MSICSTTALGSLFDKWKSKLGKLEEIFQVPIMKTTQIPLVAMNLNQSTLEGNASAILDANCQCGIGPRAAQGSDDPVRFAGHVGLVYGDFSTGEHLQSIIESQRLEKTEEAHLQFVIFVMGLFHLKMAVADTLWKTYIEPKVGQDDSQGVYTYVGIL
jgi:hypothetical protein